MIRQGQQAPSASLTDGQMEYRGMRVEGQSSSLPEWRSLKAGRNVAKEWGEGVGSEDE